jgi:seryl-tRNA synthetase
LDSERAVKISGSRFVFFKDKLALLEMALMQFVMQKLYKKGFTPIL